MREIRRLSQCLGIAVVIAGAAGSAVRAAAPLRPARLFVGLPFDGASQQPVTPRRADQLLHAKLPDSGTPETDEFLKSPNGGRVRVSTGADYLAALRRHAYPETTLDFHRDGNVARIAGALEFMRRAVPARRASLPADLPASLPVRLLWWGDGEQRREIQGAERRGASLGTFVRAGRVKSTRDGAHAATFDYAGLRHIRVEELARGDVDHDGGEEALVQVIYTMPGGTYYATELWVVRPPRRKGTACRLERFLPGS